MKKKISYTSEPKDGMELPERGFEVVSRARQRAANLPVADPPGTEYMRTEVRDHVILTAKRGGQRKGSGRKASGHVRMQLLVSPATRKKIETLAKHRKLTLSAVVEQMAAIA